MSRGALAIGFDHAVVALDDACDLLGVAYTVRYAPDRRAYKSDVASVRSQFDSQAFSAAWAEGEAMSSEEAIAFALHEFDQV